MAGPAAGCQSRPWVAPPPDTCVKSPSGSSVGAGDEDGGIPAGSHVSAPWTMTPEAASSSVASPATTSDERSVLLAPRARVGRSDPVEGGASTETRGAVLTDTPPCRRP